jgi:multiple sugar transport system permease protein
MKRRRLPSRRTLGAYVVLAVGALVFALPFVFTVTRSLQGSEQALRFPIEWIPAPVRLDNLAIAIDLLGPRAFMNSVILAGGIIIGQVALGMMAGFSLATGAFRFRDATFLVFVAGLLVPFHVMMIPLFVLVFQIGWLDSYLGLIVPMIAPLSLAVFVYRQFFLSLPRDLYDAAQMDGASQFVILRHVYAPLAGSVTVSFVIVTFVAAWNLYLWPLLVVNDQDLRPVALQLGLNGTTFGQVNPAAPEILMAMALVSTLPVLVVFLVAQRRFVRGIATTGIRG